MHLQPYLFPYTNPHLLDIVRHAYYVSMTSMARKAYSLFQTFPSLRNKLIYKAYDFQGPTPLNAYVMGAVSVSTFAIHFIPLNY